MSKIVVTLSEVKWSATAVVAFKRLTGIPPSVMESPLSTPLFESKLFMNDHPAVARMLRSLIALDRVEALDLGYYELGPDDDFGTAPHAQCRITAENLENILRAHEQTTTR